VLLTPPLFNSDFGGVPVAPDRPYSANLGVNERMGLKLAYLAVKLFSKNSNLCDHGT